MTEDKLIEMNDRVTAAESYIENYVQPLAESVEKLVSFMDQLEVRITKIEQSIQELKEQSSENDSDFATIFRKMSELSASMEIVKG
jgi:prefoldin subunit 5